MATELQVWSDESEWIIARDIDDAIAVYVEHSGCRLDKIDEAHMREAYAPLPATDVVRIWLDSEEKPTEIGTGTLVAKTCAEWIAQYGRGWLCTTEQ